MKHRPVGQSKLSQNANKEGRLAGRSYLTAYFFDKLIFPQPVKKFLAECGVHYRVHNSPQLSLP
jgi:hypothetical protein